MATNKRVAVDYGRGARDWPADGGSACGARVTTLRLAICVRLRRRCEAVAGHGVDAMEFVGDIADETKVAKFAAAVGERWGRVDVLVNNAGISMIAPAENLTAAEYRRVLEVNLVAPFLLSKAFGVMMLARRSGSIVNVASVAGLVGVADRAAYNASKHGLIGLTRTLAAEWGGRGVRVNAVCPGWVKTEMDVADQAGGGYTDADITGTGADGAICVGG